MTRKKKGPARSSGTLVLAGLRVRLLWSYSNSLPEVERIRHLLKRASSEHVRRTGPAPVTTPPRPRLTKAQNAEIVALYKAGRTPSQIAGELGTTEGTVHHRLNRNGVERRPLGMTRDEVREAVRLHDEGMPINQLAKRFGRSWTTVSNELKRTVADTTVREDKHRAQI